MSIFLLENGTDKIKLEDASTFSFTSVTGAAKDAYHASAMVTVEGNEQPISVTGAVEYSKNHAAYTTAPGTVTGGDTLKLRIMSSSSASTAVSGSVVIAEYSKPFSVTTSSVTDITPTLKTLTATGSITAASNSLVLASDPGFQIGDQIIVEIGAEAGAGARGTVGVGGTFPALNYADTTAMNADNSQAANTRCWVQTTGAAYIYSGATWGAYDETSSYYNAKAIPLSLVAVITNIAGTTLTLDRNATATATDATVYYDNLPTLGALFGEGEDITGTKIIFGTGNFALSARAIVNLQSKALLVGAGNTSTVFFSPDGCSGCLHLEQCNNVTVRDLGIIGNARFSGYAFRPLTANVFSNYPEGMTMGISSNCTADGLKITDVFQQAVGVSQGNDCWAYNCDCVHTTGLKVYIQWMFQWADSTGGGTVDCTLDSAYMMAGFETFRSSYVSMIRPSGVNFAMSSNSSGGWTFDSPNIVIEANSQLNTTYYNAGEFIITINSNIGIDALTQLGGVITNPNIVIQGVVNVSDSVWYGIVIGSDNPNISITGTYPAVVEPAGYIEYPNVTMAGNGAKAIENNGQSTVIDGIRVVGTATANGNIYTTSSAVATVQNCVADWINVASGTVTASDNLTNAEYEAL